MWRDDPITVRSSRYCPRCVRPLGMEATLCPECGETPRDQGFCGICQRHWLLPAGADCPKHELPLEESPVWEGPPIEPGESPVWVTVARYHQVIEAEAPRIRLESEGIPTFVEGERMGSHSIYQGATGGVKLQVPLALESDARIILAQSWAAHDLEEDDLEDAWEELAPAPGSSRRTIMCALIVLLLVVPLLLTLLEWVKDLAGGP